MSNKKKQIRRIFESIAGDYDFLNHLLSFGVDYYWRKKALKLSNINSDSILLDVACGTGDIAIAARKLGVTNITGADLSHNMLKIFSKKNDWFAGRNVQMVAENMPFKNNSVTNITVAFGVRSFHDIQEGLNSFYRILKKNGKATILEFSLPSNALIKWLYTFYLRRILPIIGGIISGDKEAYSYLSRSIEEFDEKTDIPTLLKSAGFKNIVKHNLTMGIVQVIIAEK